MLTLPPVAPGSGWKTNLRLPRDHHIRLDGNDYFVDPSAVGRRVLITADLEQVVATLAASHSDARGGVRVASHVRCWARHQTITDTAHDQAAARQRKVYRQQPAPPADTEVAYRDLADSTGSSPSTPT